MKSRAAKKPPQPAADPAPQPNQLNISAHREKLQECSAKTGRTVADFISDLIQEGIAKLEDAYLTSIPCPFCARADALQILGGGHIRPDLTKYRGEAIYCSRCDATVPVASWAKRGLSFEHGTAACKGGDA